MGRFIFEITDGQREKLELHRRAFGLRSLADAARDLIERRSSAPVTTPAPQKPQDPPRPAAATVPRLKPAKPASKATVDSGAGVQVGPAPVSPGSRLKKR